MLASVLPDSVAAVYLDYNHCGDDGLFFVLTSKAVAWPQLKVLHLVRSLATPPHTITRVQRCHQLHSDRQSRRWPQNFNDITDVGFGALSGQLPRMLALEKLHAEGNSGAGEEARVAAKRRPSMGS